MLLQSWAYHIFFRGLPLFFTMPRGLEALDGTSFGCGNLPLLGAGETIPAPAADVARSFLGLYGEPFRRRVVFTRSVCATTTSSFRALWAMRALRRTPGASEASGASSGVGFDLLPLSRPRGGLCFGFGGDGAPTTSSWRISSLRSSTSASGTDAWGAGEKTFLSFDKCSGIVPKFISGPGLWGGGRR